MNYNRKQKEQKEIMREIKKPEKMYSIFIYKNNKIIKRKQLNHNKIK